MKPAIVTRGARQRGMSLLVLLGISAQIAAASANIVGTVRSGSNEPVAEVMITTSSEGTAGNTVTVFSDNEGRFEIADTRDAKSGPLTVKASKFGLRTDAIEMSSGDGGATATTTIAVTMSADAGPPEFAPPSAWFAHKDKSEGQRVTMMQCVLCHQFPTARVRAFAATFSDTPHDVRLQAWKSMVYRMAHLFDKTFDEFSEPGDHRAGPRASPGGAYVQDGMIGDLDQATIAAYLASEMPKKIELAAYSAAQVPELTVGTEIREYEMKPFGQKAVGMMHDVTVAKGPGGNTYGWGADQHGSVIVRVGEDGSQKWFRTPMPNAGPHTIVPDSEGYLWVTLQNRHEIGRFDPNSETWQVYGNLSDGGMTHSFANNWKFQVGFDTQGRLWTTLIGQNKLASLNPKTRVVKEFDLPIREGDSPFYTEAYGAVMTADRKYVWFTQVGGEVLGCFNTETERVETVVRYPKGTNPRRLAITEDDILWVPLYGASQLMAYDAKSRKEIGRYDLPDRNATPYSLSWDYTRKVVWITGTNSNMVYRFDPATESFAQLRLPRQDAFMRSLPIDHETGDLWTSYANLASLPGAPYMVVRIKPGSVATHPR